MTAWHSFQEIWNALAVGQQQSYVLLSKRVYPTDLYRFKKKKKQRKKYVSEKMATSYVCFSGQKKRGQKGATEKVEDGLSLGHVTKLLLYKWWLNLYE